MLCPGVNGYWPNHFSDASRPINPENCSYYTTRAKQRGSLVFELIDLEESEQLEVIRPVRLNARAQC